MRGEREILLRVFDTRQPGALERLRREISGWYGYAREAWIDEYQVRLVARPGGALDSRANTNASENRKSEAAS
jgi:hypothetical protein